MTIEARINRLEATAFRAEVRHDEVTDQIGHLTAAIGDLSQAQRAVGMDVTEIKALVLQVLEHVKGGGR